MSLLIERIWVRTTNNYLVWPKSSVCEIVKKLNSWPEVSNIHDFTQAAQNGHDVYIDEENFKWGGAGSRDIESLRFILSLCTETVETWAEGDNGAFMECVWPVEA